MFHSVAALLSAGGTHWSTEPEGLSVKRFTLVLSAAICLAASSQA
jgi:hypothetical protein